MADYQSLFNVPTISDFQREEEDFNMRKQQGALQNQLMQKQLQQAQELDIKALSDRALFDFYQGKPLDDQSRAAIQARAVMEGQKTQYTQDAKGYLVPTTTDNPYSQFLAGLDGGQYKPARTPRSAIPTQSFGNMLGEPALEDGNIPQVSQDTFSFDGYNGMDPMKANQQAATARAQELGGANPYAVPVGSALPDAGDMQGVDVNSPLYESTVTEEAAKNAMMKNSPDFQLKEKEFKLKQDAANKEAQTKKEARAQVSSFVNEMAKGYNELKDLGSAVSYEQTLSQNIPAYLRSTTVGQFGERMAGTQSQAIRDRINTNQPNLINAIRQATGMSAKAMDSNRELQFYLQATGDPTKDVSANLAALQVLNDTYGLGAGKFADPAEVEKLKAQVSQNVTSQPSKSPDKFKSGEIDFKLKKQGFTPEQIQEYKKARGL